MNFFLGFFIFILGNISGLILLGLLTTGKFSDLESEISLLRKENKRLNRIV